MVSPDVIVQGLYRPYREKLFKKAGIFVFLWGFAAKRYLTYSETEVSEQLYLTKSRYPDKIE
jgi:hypothetical protein